MSLDRVATTIIGLATIAILGNPIAAYADKGTGLLFSFVTNQSGFDTGISIANTNADPFGDKVTAGQCTLSYFSATGAAFASQTTTQIDAGRSAVFTLSAGGSNGVAARPGFQGYIIADCDFPNARGFGFISDLGARNLAANVPVEVIKQRDRH